MSPALQSVGLFNSIHYSEPTYCSVVDFHPILIIMLQLRLSPSKHTANIVYCLGFYCNTVDCVPAS